MITEYTIAYAETTDRLVLEVNLKISEGWQPKGGIFGRRGLRGKTFYQALIKEFQGVKVGPQQIKSHSKNF